MKKPEWIFVGILVLVAAYFVFSYLNRDKKFNSWNLVTANAAIVYESNSIINTWNKVVKSDVWESISNIEEVRQINKNLQLIDTLSGGNGQLAKLFKKQNTIISAHVTSQSSYGLTYFLPLGKKGYTVLLQVLANLPKELKVKKNQRVYQGLTIYELQLATCKVSYLVYKNTLVVSTQAFLVEDVVRNIKNDFKKSFIASYPTLKGNPSFATDDGNLYINGLELPLFANSFLGIKNRIGNAYSLAGSMFFDITLNNQGLFASGFAYEGKKNALISTFKNQQAVGFNLMGLIPKNAAIVEHFGSSNLSAWYSKWVKLQHNNTINQEQGKQFVSFLKNEMAQITLQSVDNKHLNKLFVAELSDIAGMYNHLNKIAEQQITQSFDSLYIEKYADHEIRLIDSKPILKEYFGPSFEGFNSTYYLIYNNYLVIANTAETLRNWLIQVNNEFTWSKSVRMNMFFKNALTEANYTYVTNFEYSWNLQLGKLNKNLKLWVGKNSSTLKEYNLLAFQISNLDNRYYTNFYVNYAPTPKVVAEKKVFDISTIQLTNRVILKPKVVKNYKTGAWEILLQDSLTNVMLVSNTDEIMWEDSLGVKLKGAIYQIDYFKNNKLQYLLHSDSSLFLIDRKGQTVENYPIKLNYKINKVYLIDYDQSKKYRILISDYFGNLRMYDKGGKILDGWNPNVFGSNFSNDIFHLRVRGKDRILIPLSNGEVHLKNRRGKEMDGFPLDLGTTITNDIYTILGENFDDTHFVTVSKDGLVIRFTMTGKMLSRNQLSKESGQSQFKIVIEKQKKDYVFVRNDLNRLAVMTSDGTLLFEKDFPTNQVSDVQYYNFGSDRELYIVKTESSIYLYNRQGKLLNNTPLNSDFPISLVYFSNHNICQLYLSHNNTVEVKKIYL